MYYTRYLPPEIQSPSLLTDFSFRLRTAGCIIPANYRRQFNPPSLLTDFSFCWRTAGCIPATYRGTSVPSLLTDFSFRWRTASCIIPAILTAGNSVPFIADRFFVPLENRWLYTRYLPRHFSPFIADRFFVPLENR